MSEEKNYNYNFRNFKAESQGDKTTLHYQLGLHLSLHFHNEVEGCVSFSDSDNNASFPPNDDRVHQAQLLSHACVPVFL